MGRMTADYDIKHYMVDIMRNTEIYEVTMHTTAYMAKTTVFGCMLVGGSEESVRRAARFIADLAESAIDDPHIESDEAKVDRGALLALADSMERRADDFDATLGDVPMVHAGYLTAYAERIRGTLGVES